MIHRETFSLDVDGRTLRGSVLAPGRSGPSPAVVVSHGFKGFMDWGFFPHLAELLTQRGFCVVRFNFSGSGMAPGDEIVTDLEAFRTATFSKDARELRAVLAAVGGAIAAGHADPNRMALVGHSRGGGTSLLAAATTPRLRALVTWAAVSRFDRLPEPERRRWRRDGEIPVVNARTGQRLLVDHEVLADLEANRHQLDLEWAAQVRRAPWLILHGSADETVPIAEARILARSAAQPVELREIVDGDHTFGSRHPFTGPTPQLIEAMNATQLWLRRYLADEEAGPPPPA